MAVAFAAVVMLGCARGSSSTANGGSVQRRTTIGIIGALIASTSCAAPTTVPAVDRAVDVDVFAGIDAARVQQGTLGVSVAVVQPGHDVRAAAFGQRGPHDTAAVTVRTRFPAASISKAVTSLAFLSSPLSSRLDTPVAPTLVGVVDVPSDVTVRSLLTHSAGADTSGYAGREPSTTLPSLDEIAGAVRFGEGRGFSYSGGGFEVFEAWLVRVAGMELDTFVTRTLLAPAGTVDSAFDQPVDDGRGPHACGGEEALGPYCTAVHPERAAAGLWTTPTDLVKTAAFVIARHPEALARVKSSAVEMPDAPVRMGVGLPWRDADGVTVFSHTGRNIGFCSRLVFFADGRAVAAMDNGCKGTAASVVDSVCAALGWSCSPPT